MTLQFIPCSGTVTAIVAAILASVSAPTVHAGAGVGISYVFGQGLTVGVKIFSDDKEGNAVGTAGLDYLLGSGAWRPNIGIGYLGDNHYGDLNAGYNYQIGRWSLGVGAGGTETRKDKPTGSGSPAPGPIAQ